MDQKVLDTLEYSNSYSSNTKICWKTIEEEGYIKNELCIIGNQKVSPQYVLLGDSHASVIIDPPQALNEDVRACVIAPIPPLAYPHEPIDPSTSPM